MVFKSQTTTTEADVGMYTAVDYLYSSRKKDDSVLFVFLHYYFAHKRQQNIYFGMKFLCSINLIYITN